MLHVLQSNPNDIIRNKDKKNQVLYGLKVLSLIIVKGKIEDESKVDVIKHTSIPNLTLNLLK